MKFLQAATRHFFFTGKGGVGKTSLACAAAVQLADGGRQVLLVSTDPASNLDEVLGTSLNQHPTPVAGVVGLSAINLDPEQAAAEYRERMVGPYRALLPAAAVASMEEQFSGSCTVEIAAFDAFAQLLGNPSATASFDHVVFDTAPTGHTLRLLTLPSAWLGYMESNTTGTSCLGPLAGLQGQQQLYQDTMAALADAASTTMVLVARPEATALSEAARASRELAALGVRNQHLTINGVFHATDPADHLAVAMQQRGAAALNTMPVELRELPSSRIPLAGSGLMGVAALRQLGKPSPADAADVATAGPPLAGKQLPPRLGTLLDDLAAPGHGVILVMGKGGVGKTTVAAAVAVGLAERGLNVHLTTTDPAAHLAGMIASDARSNLTVSRIDPAIELQHYAAEVLRTAGAGLDAHGLELLTEDLRSPCTEEIAVFRAFAKTVAEGTDRFVVLDTAPTGHTILLLDAALAFHREVTRQSNQLPASIAELLPRLRDADFSRVLIVTLPEATPVHEAAQLQRDLRRAGIEPYAWAINQSLAPLQLSDAVLCGRQRREAAYVHEVVTEHAGRAVMIPWQVAAPVGYQALCQLSE